MITNTKEELIKAVAGQAGITLAEAKRAVNAVTENMIDTLEGLGRFALAGIGVFRVVKRAARQGRNPQTGEAIAIASKKAIKFKMADLLKGIINIK